LIDNLCYQKPLGVSQGAFFLTFYKKSKEERRKKGSESVIKFILFCFFWMKIILLTFWVDKKI